MLNKLFRKIKLLDVLIATYFVLHFSVSTQGSQKHETFYQNLEVYSYRHFGSLQTIYFEIPLDSSSFSWNLTINKSRPACEDMQFNLYLQHGSFPIDHHDGAKTFPCSYKTERTGMMKDNLTTSKTIHVENPLYGQWFLGALMPKNANQVVKKLSSIGCDYGLGGNLTYIVEEATVLSPGTRMDINGNSQSNYYKFLIGTNVYKYVVRLEAAGSRQTGNVSVTTRSGALPGAKNPPIHDLACSADAENCSLEFDVYAPEVEKWQYLRLQSEDEGSPLPPMTINITLYGCTTGSLKNATKVPTCYMTPPLSAVTKPDGSYSSDFAFNPDNDRIVLVSRPFVSMTHFSVDRFKDIGGTLAVEVTVGPIDVGGGEETTSDFDVHLCLRRGRMTISSSDAMLSCDDENSIVRLNSSSPTSVIHVPYPEPGIYFIGHQDFNQSLDRNANETTKAVGEPKLGIFVKVSIKACQDSKCQNGGECRSGMNAPFLMSYCYCLAGSRGITCADETNMASRGVQMLYTLLLSLSNLAFIPSIVVAFKRWRYMECSVYFFNMICSAFYHACDMNQWSMYSLCFVNYRLYQFSDFFLSLLSFWVSLLAMSRIRSGFLIPVLVTGVVVIAVVTASNPAGPLGNVLPLATGVLIVAVTWAWRSFRSKALYPPKEEYLWSLPGVGLAALGLVIFAFVETDANYPYTHSFWHVCVASCIPFVLPRERVVWELTEISRSKYTVPSEFQEAPESDEIVLVYSNNGPPAADSGRNRAQEPAAPPTDDRDCRALP